jgi:hemoglobin
MKLFRTSNLPPFLALIMAAGAGARAADPQDGRPPAKTRTMPTQEKQSSRQNSDFEPVKPAALSADDLDLRIHELAVKVLQEGPGLYNGTPYKARSPVACTYLFKGALTGMAPLLDHRPDLQQSVRLETTRAMAKSSPEDQAFALLDVLLKVKKELDPNSFPIPADGTLWERLGGTKNVKRIVDLFVDASVQDPAVNFTRNGKFPLDPIKIADIKGKIVQLTSAAAGGPEKVYLHLPMKEIHKGMAITDAEFDAMARQLRLALLSCGVRNTATIEEVMGAVAIAKSQIVQPPAAMKAPAGVKANPPVEKTLWDRLGGEKQVTKIVDEFIDAALKDRNVNFTRGGKYPLDAKQVTALKRHIVTLASAVANGPLAYEGQPLKKIHQAMAITDGEFDALLQHLTTALLRNKVAADDIALVRRAVETTRADVVRAR